MSNHHLRYRYHLVHAQQVLTKEEIVAHVTRTKVVQGGDESLQDGMVRGHELTTTMTTTVGTMVIM